MGANGHTVSFVLLAIAAAVWLWVALALRVVYRPRRPRPGPPSTDLGPEPPAVVNLITHDWRVTSSAVPATLLDLADRSALEIIQVDPEHDVVRLRHTGRQPRDLLPYERQVLDHLRRTAVDGVVPATALTTGPATASDAWWRRFQRSVVADGRARGLTRPRFPTGVAVGLGAALVLLVVWLALAAHAAKDAAPGDGPSAWAVTVAIVSLGACGLLLGRFDRNRQRDTDAGLAAAGRWLGVRRGYADASIYAELPPAAVVLYGPHLAQAAAMDVATRTIARLPLGAEDDHLAWSHEGGRWRQVEVAYPTRRVGWGERPIRAVASGMLWTLLLVVPIVVANRVGSRLLGDLQDAARSVGSVKDTATRVYSPEVADRIGLVATWLVVLALAGLVWLAVRNGPVRLVRGLMDLRRSHTVTGLVVRRRTWPRARSGQDVDVHWVAVDDGTSTALRAYSVDSRLARPIHQGDQVELDATPALGFVRAASVLTAAAPLPRPRSLADLPGPSTLPPVHWIERLDSDGASDDALPPHVTALTAALARQIERLRASRATKR